MDILSASDNLETTLVVCPHYDNPKREQEFKDRGKVVIPELLKEIEKETVTKVILHLPIPEISPQILSEILKALKPESPIVIPNIADGNDTEFLLKTNGFTNVKINETNVSGQKPRYAVGSSAKLNLKKPAVWKLDDDNEDLIDPDDLLDEDDLKTPDPSSLKVCGTTGKRKACKDCSCGLADELAAEAQTGKVVDTTDAPKSSCGSVNSTSGHVICPFHPAGTFRKDYRTLASGIMLLYFMGC